MALGDYKSGERVTALVAVRRVDRREHNGRPYVTLNVGDKTAAINAVMWEGFEGVVEQVRPGVVVRIQGVLGDYRDQPQIKIERMRVAKADEYDAGDFLPVSAVPRAELARRLDEVLASITDPDFRALLDALFSEGPLRERFLAAPGAQRWHHSVVGGLAEHTLNVVRICDFCAAQYPELERDLLIGGALLHDVGKIEQYATSTVFEYTDAGRLVGHLVQGDELVRTAMDRLGGFPPQKAMLLRHLMLAHHGQLEHQSPVEPMTREAFVLHYADEVDAKLGGLRKVAEKTGEARWSEYVKLLDRFIYFGTTKDTPADGGTTGTRSAGGEDR